MQSIYQELDHLVYATPDLSLSLSDIGDLLGVAPALGGQHPAWGTRNALIALGPQMYLEILGPDWDKTQLGQPRPFNIDSLDRPRMVTWASRAEHLEEIVERARGMNIDLGEVQAGNRRRTDGSLLEWTMTDPMAPRLDGIVPFFINWGHSDHPAQGVPIGCALYSLRAKHPEPERLSTILAGLGLDLHVEPGDEPKLIATIDCPRGRVDLT
jgi:hypothetical protein